MRRPGIWVANGSPSNAQKMFSWRPGALTSFYDYLGPNQVIQYKTQHPDAIVIVRFQHPRNWHQDPTQSARNLGNEVANKWPDLRDIDPYVYFANEVNLHYENGDDNVGNQPKYESTSFYENYANWVRMTADQVKQRVPDMKLVTPPFAFGHHEDGAPDNKGNPTEGWAGYDYLADTVRSHFNNILTFHAYWGHSGGSVRDWLYDQELSSWYAFRWRRVLRLFERRYGIKAKLLIDEAGNMSASDEDFTDQVIYYASQCLADERVLGITYFLWEDPTMSPGNIPNSWVQRCKNLDSHLARLASLEDIVARPPVEPAPTGDTVRVLMGDGSVQVLSVEEYLRGVVPSEMSARWPEEALKAQAVAARSYAMVAKKNPRHKPNADLCDSTHCQVYNPDRINPLSDAAVEATAGEVIMYGGDVAHAYYSANCGGHTVSNKEGFGGAQLPYLLGVPCVNKGEKNGHGVGLCQWGAHDMAKQGKDYVTILKHYFTGIYLSGEEKAKPDKKKPEVAEEPEEVPTGIILGKVVDQTGAVLANVELELTCDDYSANTNTDRKGAFKFAHLPEGIYTLEAVDYEVKREGIVLGKDGVVPVTLTVSVVESCWTMTVERSSGLPVLAGTLPEARIPITLRSPTGNTYKALSGTKPEYGVGGFEFWAPTRGEHEIVFLREKFKVNLDGQFTLVTFAKADEVAKQDVLTGTPPAGRDVPEPVRDAALAVMTPIRGMPGDEAACPSGSEADTGAEPKGEGQPVVEAEPHEPTPGGQTESEEEPDSGGEDVPASESEPVSDEDALPEGQTEPDEDAEPEDEPESGEDPEPEGDAEPGDEPEPESPWLMKVVRGTGLPLIVGSLPEANMVLTVQPPEGAAVRVLSGTKPEFGVGGFEVPAPQRGVHTLQFLDQTFKLPMDRQFTRITFVRGSVPAEGQARLVSISMVRSEAEDWLGVFESDETTTGMFSLDEA